AIVTDDADVAEDGIDAFAVGDGRFGGERVLDVERAVELPLERLLAPQHLAAVGVEADHLPGVSASGRLAVEVGDVQPLARLGLLVGTGGGRDEDASA